VRGYFHLSNSYFIPNNDKVSEELRVAMLLAVGVAGPMTLLTVGLSDRVLLARFF
jgi:hypothetical protein